MEGMAIGIAVVLGLLFILGLSLYKMARLRIDKPKPEPSPARPPEPTEWERTLSRFPIGTQFTYLGVNMLVTQHDPGSRKWCAAFTCEYVDNNGKLHEWHFTEPMLPMIERFCHHLPQSV
jgi:hypothetical protein